MNTYGLLSAAFFFCTFTFAATSAEDTGDWPQWRGPNRDGVARNSPPLLDKWPAEGPKLVWKSQDRIPGPHRKADNNGGSGSVVVADGKVLVYSHQRTLRPFKVDPALLEKWGWHPDMSPEMAKKLNEVLEKLPGWRHGKVDPKVSEEAATKFLAALPPDQAKKFAQSVHNRLTTGKKVRLKLLKNLAKGSGQTFKTFYELQKKVGSLTWTHNVHGGYVAGYFIDIDSISTDEVYCLEANSGKTLWKQSLPGASTKNRARWPASGTPAVDGKHCYVVGSKSIFCLSLDDGKLVWQKEVGFTNTSPLVGKNIIYAFTPELAAFDKSSGKELWRLKGLANMHGSPCIWKHQGDEYVLADGKGGLHCVQGSNGKVLWKVKGGSPASPVMYGNDHVLASHGGDNANIYLVKLDLKTPQVLWKTKGRGPKNRGWASPIVHNDIAYRVGQTTSAVDLKTGKELWRQGKLGGSTSSPLVADNKLIYPTHGASKRYWELIQTSVSTEGMSVQGQVKLNLAQFSSPALVDGRLYVRMTDGVACYDLRR